MASAVVRTEPEPEKLAKTRAAAHTVVERGMFTNYVQGLSQIKYLGLWMRSRYEACYTCQTCSFAAHDEKRTVRA
jgi:hypothetical protein